MRENNDESLYWWQRNFVGETDDRVDISDTQLAAIAAAGADPRHFWRVQGRCLCCGQELLFAEFQNTVMFGGRSSGRNIGAVCGITVSCEGHAGHCCEAGIGDLLVWKGGSSLLEQWNHGFTHPHLSFRPCHGEAAARESARITHAQQCELLGLGPVNLRCYERDEDGIQELDELARSGGSDEARSRSRRFLF